MNDFIAWLHQQLAQRVAAPRYIQLAATIEMAIKQQVLAVKDFLPSERQMAEELALSRVTVSKAMKLLQEKALISRQQGVGTQVAMHNGYPFSLDSSFTPHGSISNEWLLRTCLPAPAHIAEALDLESNAVVTKLRRLRLLDGSPVSLETIYIPLSFLPDPEKLENSLYALWQSRNIVPEGKHFQLKAVACTEEIAGLLNVNKGTPLLHILQTSRNALGKMLEFSETLCRSDVYQFEVSHGGLKARLISPGNVVEECCCP
ncbi:GntR family transcriptional regulator [Pseudomonas lundensis]|uniref:GntR family transcriptional regulator n=1 Tax=Serratia proteamaculans TaxID=28151 RepID=UPI002982B34E|nr:GntR family transcriptional regulator [Serratia proteamaculans]MDW5501855.1 GntR family transcriptional regulator [Serratia proteamaculans]MDW5506916.1 GntR family transcriptional regulator [Pseudomonas lundensis]